MTRLRLPIGRRDTEAEGEVEKEVTDADEGSSGGVGRKLLAALGVVGAAYLAVRRLRSSDDGTGGDASEDDSASGDAEASPQETTSDRDEEPTADVPGEDRSPEEIAERVGEDVDAKPAEPGEMAIDESVVEDAVDETELSTTDEEDGPAENDEDAS